MSLNRALIVVGCAVLGAAAVVIAMNALAFLAQAMDVAWLRDVAVNTGPLAVAGGAAAGGAAAGGGGASGDPGPGEPTLGTPPPPLPPGQRWDPTTHTWVSAPEPEGPPRSAGPHFDDVTWQITFSQWVQVIAGSRDTTLDEPGTIDDQAGPTVNRGGYGDDSLPGY